MAIPIQIVFDTADPDREATFWAAALGYQLQPPPGGFDSWEAFLEAQRIPRERWNDASAITDPDGKGPRVFFQRVPEGKTAKNRMHMDLNVGGGSDVPLDERKRRVNAEVRRLKALGATDERGAIEKDGEYWVRMNDPEGNEFCVQ
jgi:glyoxalase superfamily protein